MKSNIQQYLESIKGSKFIKLNNYYSGETSELSDVVVNVGISYENAKLKDIKTLEEMDITKYISLAFDQPLLEQARKELIESLKTPSKSHSDAQVNTYNTITSNIKIKKDTQEVYIYGTVLNKKVVVDGEHKEVKSKPLTLAKNVLKKELRTGHWRQYKITNIDSIKCGDVYLENNSEF